MPIDEVVEALRPVLRRWCAAAGGPYRLSFGANGATFGVMRTSPGAADPEARQAFRDALLQAGFSGAAVAGLVRRLMQPHPTLSEAEVAQVDAALLTSSSLIDALDERLLVQLCRQTEACAAVAEACGRPLQPDALPDVALWIAAVGSAASVMAWLRAQKAQGGPIGAAAVRGQMHAELTAAGRGDTAARIAAARD